ncbi:MAG TPA: hypothetical protein VKU94_05350 [Geobacterales bacterium]|nr:hypothetical protein [Geobacterales bacterium]
MSARNDSSLLDTLKSKSINERIEFWRKLMGCKDAVSISKYVVKLAPITTDPSFISEEKEGK